MEEETNINMKHTKSRVRLNSSIIILIKLLLILSSCLFTLSIIEIFLRIINPQVKVDGILSLQTQNVLKLDPSLIYSRKPFIYSEWKTDEFIEKTRTNHLGWRDRNIEKKDQDTYRIIAVGDSYTFGQGIESNKKTYPKQLENYLQRSDMITKKIEVFNAGEKGYTPDQEYRLIIERVISQNPNLIVWNFTNPDDLRDLTNESTWPIPSLYDIKNNNLIPLDARYNWIYITNYLSSNIPRVISESHLFKLAVKTVSQIHYFNRKPNLSKKESIKWALQKMVLEVDHIQQLGKKYNFKLIIVILPKKIVFTSPADDYIAAFIEFETILKKKGLTVISIKQELEKNSILTINSLNNQIIGNNNKILDTAKISIDTLYFKKDHHPNEIFARIFAEIIYPFVLKTLE